MSRAFARGARGFIVGNLQKGLGNIAADGDFGGKTEARVKEVQTALGHVPNGRADESLFKAIGVRWPSDFEVCLNITDAFEGTGFGGVNKRDEDGAGVTLGVVGFTTQHGEVQRLVSEYIKSQPKALDKVPSPHRDKLLILTRSSGRNRESWDRWFYGGDGIIDKWIRDVVAGWGEDPLFRKLQLDMIAGEKWKPTLNAYIHLGLRSLEGLALLFDITVQNGGWARRHEAHYSVDSAASETEKLRAIAHAVAACARADFQHDTLTRKMVFVQGTGKVHGHEFDLSCCGF